MKFFIMNLLILFAFTEKGSMIKCNMLQSNKKKHVQENELVEDVEDVDAGSECYNYGCGRYRRR